MSSRAGRTPTDMGTRVENTPMVAGGTEPVRAPRRREGLRERIRVSLVLRLNLRSVLRLVSILTSVNLLILALCAGAAFLTAENRAGKAAAAIAAKSDPAVRALLPEILSTSTGYRITIDGYRGEWPESVLEDPDTTAWTRWMRLDGLDRAADARREFITEGSTASAPAEWMDRTLYRIRYPLAVVEGQVYTVVSISVPLRPPLLYTGYAFAPLLLLELFLLLGSIGGGARSARKVLRPIDEMARVTRNINASRLDTRLNLRGSQNELKDLAGTINDMLERIDTAYRSQIRFVSDASHELRTPIAVIQGYANLLDRWGKNDPQTLQESIAALKAESENMKELVEKLLFLARGDNNTLTLRMEPLYVDRLVRLLARETAMIDKSHTFRITCEDHLAVVADAQLLKQALRILIDNSIKYTPAGNEITIGCTADPDRMVRITVQDTGIGIPAADVPHVFDRFYRADESRTRATGGAGLGLSIAKWIVERHSGRIEVLSRQGFGTRMSILLPPVSDKAGLAQAETSLSDGGEEIRAIPVQGGSAVLSDHPVPPGLVR